MIPLLNKPNVNGSSPTYPFGETRNNPGDNTGTPVNTILVGDVVQLMEKVMHESGITANGLPDNEANGWQLFEAFRKVMQPFKEFTGLYNVVLTTISNVNVFNNTIGSNPTFSNVSNLITFVFPDLVGKSVSDLDISIEITYDSIIGTYSIGTPIFDPVNGSIQFHLRLDSGLSTGNCGVRLQVRQK